MKKCQLTATQLKTIAIIAMLLDHIAWLFLPTQWISAQIIHAFGRLTAPIMCFFIAEGYHYTSNRKKYLGRLFLFAVISHFPYVICFDYPWYRTTSVMWSLAMGLLALCFLKNEKIKSWLKILCFIGFCLLAYFADWSYIPILWITAFGCFHGKVKYQLLSFSIIGLATYVLHNWAWYKLGIFLVIPLLCLYNGSKGGNGKFQKWFFYVFYPLHLFLLYFLWIILYNIVN